jgi:hypothetical protein
MGVSGRVVRMAMALPRMGVLPEEVVDDDLGMAMAGGLVSLSFSHSKWIEARRGGAVVAVGRSGSGVVLWWCRASRCLPFGSCVQESAFTCLPIGIGEVAVQCVCFSRAIFKVLLV